jgi:uncharacterized protein YraI
MPKIRLILPLLALWLAVVNCNLPNAGAGAETPTGDIEEQIAGTMTALSSNAGGQGSQPTATSAAPQPVIQATLTSTPCGPTVTANVNANIRSGPGTVYDQIGALLQGQSAAVSGRNAEGSWWYISKSGLPGGVGWIAGSTVTASCLPTSVAVIAAPPTPTPQPVSGTCKDGYVWRLINASDKVCVPPASKTQADADNAAANSRKLVNVYGPDACKVGYVWREAFSGDHVCVTPATRSQAQADNAAAASRVDPANPPYCVVGYVWREATGDQTDKVCVTPDVRSQAAADNAAAASRVAGPNDCISGYVWREAFAGDLVCVTPDVKAQVAADNAAAPSRTWP